MTHIIRTTRPTFPTFVPPRVLQMLSLHRQRQALSRLDDTQLRDLGLTRKETQSEVRRPLWDVPCHWQD